LKIDRVVVKLSGSIFKSKVDASDLEPFIELFSKLRRGGLKLAVVAGGGENARRYIRAARRLGADESTLDEIGIEVSRLNAKLILTGISELAYPSIPTSLSEVAGAFEEKGLVIAGGLHPGQSTNAVACLIAERVKADLFVNGTDVDGVYSKDPRVERGAERLSRVTTGRLREMLSKSVMGAGTYTLMDLVALSIIERSKIKTRVVICTPEALAKAVEGEDVGTLITPG